MRTGRPIQYVRSRRRIAHHDRLNYAYQLRYCVQRQELPLAPTPTHPESRLASENLPADALDNDQQASPKLPELGPDAMDISPKDIRLTDLNPSKTVEPPRLHHELDRVLFNPGVYRLQCPRTNVFNFDPFLQKLPRASTFDMHSLPPYKPPSRDESLIAQFKSMKPYKYVGATSTCTRLLQQLHFAISAWRPINTNSFSRSFSPKMLLPTRFQTAPSSTLLRCIDDGKYVIDPDLGAEKADKELMRVGHIMERMFTMPKKAFRQHLKNDQPPKYEDNKETFEHDTMQNAYNYTGIGSFLVRSQLDAMDERIASRGQKGYLDIKTRAALAVRMDPLERLEQARGYQIKKQLGDYESYEREMYDLARTMLLKYSLQARLGQMEGIFLAYHNLSQIFGFQYLSVEDMDIFMHGPGGKTIGHQEFRMSFAILESILDRITERFSGSDVWIHFHTLQVGKTGRPDLVVFAERPNYELRRELNKLSLGRKVQEESGTPREGEDDILAQEAAHMQSLVSKLQKQSVIFAQFSNNRDIPAEEYATIYHTYTTLEKNAERFTDDLKASGTGEEDFSAVMEVIQNVLRVTKVIIDNIPAELLHRVQQLAEITGERASSWRAFHWRHQPEDLFGLRVKFQNIVDGETVIRPERAVFEDTWKIRYTINEIEDQSEKLSQYRRTLGEQFVLKDEDVAEDLYNTSYSKLLQKFSNQGREWFRKIQKSVERSGPVVFQSHRGSASRSKARPKRAQEARRRQRKMKSKNFARSVPSVQPESIIPELESVVPELDAGVLEPMSDLELESVVPELGAGALEPISGRSEVVGNTLSTPLVTTTTSIVEEIHTPSIHVPWLTHEQLTRRPYRNLNRKLSKLSMIARTMEKQQNRDSTINSVPMLKRRGVGLRIDYLLAIRKLRDIKSQITRKHAVETARLKKKRKAEEWQNEELKSNRQGEGARKERQSEGAQEKLPEEQVEEEKDTEEQKQAKKAKPQTPATRTEEQQMEAHAPKQRRVERIHLRQIMRKLKQRLRREIRKIKAEIQSRTQGKKRQGARKAGAPGSVLLEAEVDIWELEGFIPLNMRSEALRRQVKAVRDVSATLNRLRLGMPLEPPTGAEEESHGDGP